MNDALIENVMNALAAGLILGSIYGLMCLGLGLIFGIMKIVNFAQGELLMLGMFVSFYLVTASGALAPLGVVAPFVAALAAGPVLFLGGAALHRLIIARVSGLRTAGALDEGAFGQLIVTLGLSLILQNGGQIAFGSAPKSVLTPLAAHAFIIGPVVGDATLFLNKARVFACLVSLVIAAILYVVMERSRLGKALRAAADNPTAATYMGIDVDRAYRIAFGLGSRRYRDRGRVDGDVSVIHPVRRPGLRDHHVFGGGAGRHGQHPGRLLGRVDGGAGSARLRAGPAAAAAERGHLRGVSADRRAEAAGFVRPFGGARLRDGAGPRLKRDAIALAVVTAAYLVLAALVRNSYYQLMLTLVPIWAMMGLAWNLISGYSGLVSFGHAAFFGVGAYTVTLALVYLDLTPWLGIPLGALVGAIAALLIGWPTFRLRGHYFALSMLAYPLAILYVLEYLGFQEVSLPIHRAHPAAFLQFTDPRLYTLVAVVLLAAGVLICMVAENARFGLALLAIRQNELAAEAAGLNTWRWKMRGLVASGRSGGCGRGLYACVLLVVTPDSVFGVLVSAQALVVTLFGGVGTVWGPLIGAAILIPLAETLNAQLGSMLPGIQGVVYGCAIIAVMLAAPEGIFWTMRDRFFRRPAPPVRRAATFAQRAVRVAHRPGTLLDVRHLSRSFGGLRAVDDVSFTVEAGEILGIIGPNGAGKTTLFNVLNGILPPTSGEAFFAGTRITGRKIHDICHLGIGRTFQVVRSFPRLPVLDNVVVGAYGAGLAGP